MVLVIIQEPIVIQPSGELQFITLFQYFGRWEWLLNQQEEEK